MAKQKEGVYERIIQCAAREFLEKGYTDASLRTIAAEADTSTNSIYVRFGDKEGLFAAIVEPVYKEFLARVLDIQETFHGFSSDEQRARVGQYSTEGLLRLLDYIYAHFDEFRLLLDASHGTRFCNFVDELVSIEENYTRKWLDATNSRLELEGELPAEFFHMMVTSYFEGIFEIVRHEMSLENAKKYVAMMSRYHHAGFLAIIGDK
ncbi:MAG: TetR/AcrR family transcriptional regulator [Lachnospiraceae bacterium]|nr:TetR/AcrR family transcriptional regulator [Ruminococcus sp.]MCM1276307.1 TetR/AcrR family transcriptional regulator [Lachnospiraceae bacterium]